MSQRRAICVHFKNGHWPWKCLKFPVPVTQGQSEKHAFRFTFSFDFSPPYAQELHSHGQDRLLSMKATRVDKAGANHTNLSWHDAIILCFAFWVFALKRQNSPTLYSAQLLFISGNCDEDCPYEQKMKFTPRTEPARLSGRMKRP